MNQNCSSPGHNSEAVILFAIGMRVSSCSQLSRLGAYSSDREPQANEETEHEQRDQRRIQPFSKQPEQLSHAFFRVMPLPGELDGVSDMSDHACLLAP